MTQIHYLIGDATEPVGHGPKILAHVCNDIGGWGAGFVLALSRKDTGPEELYRAVAASRPLQLGENLLCGFGPDEENITVANMIAQRGFKTLHNDVPLDYKALRQCLDEVGQEAADMNATVHMPRIGTGLGGGKWAVVEEAILAILVDVYHVDVFVYDLPTPASIEDHHLMDEADEHFQQGLHDLAARSGG